MRRANLLSATSCEPRFTQPMRSTLSWRLCAGAASTHCSRYCDATCESGKPIRVLTTTYTNSTEQRALDELTELGAEVRVSYDTSMTRLHAKAWMFHRAERLLDRLRWLVEPHSLGAGDRPGMERSALRRAAILTPWPRSPRSSRAIGRVTISFRTTRRSSSNGRDRAAGRVQLPAADRPRAAPVSGASSRTLAVARQKGTPKPPRRGDRNGQDRDGGGRLRTPSCSASSCSSPVRRTPRGDPRAESATFRHALRDASFGEKWVGGQRPTAFDHVFASIQSLTSSGVAPIDPTHFDVVIVDEFHHAAAPSYAAPRAVLSRQLLGLTATPERADGARRPPVLRRSYRGRAAGLGRDRSAVPRAIRLLRRSTTGSTSATFRGDAEPDTTSSDLTNVLTADHVWARRIVAASRDEDQRSVGDAGAWLLRERPARPVHGRAVHEARIASVAIWGDSPRSSAAARFAISSRAMSGSSSPSTSSTKASTFQRSTRLLLLRPTDSPTLFLQQLGRGLRRAPKVGLHRPRLRRTASQGVPVRPSVPGPTRRKSQASSSARSRTASRFFRPAVTSSSIALPRRSCLRSIRDAIPTTWREQCSEPGARRCDLDYLPEGNRSGARRHLRR